MCGDVQIFSHWHSAQYVLIACARIILPGCNLLQNRTSDHVCVVHMCCGGDARHRHGRIRITPMFVRSQAKQRVLHILYHCAWMVCILGTLHYTQVSCCTTAHSHALRGTALIRGLPVSFPTPTGFVVFFCWAHVGSGDTEVHCCRCHGSLVLARQ